MNCKTKLQHKKTLTLWPLFMDGIQLSQGYRATTRRQFPFYHSVPRFPGVPGTQWQKFTSLKYHHPYRPWKAFLFLQIIGFVDSHSNYKTKLQRAQFSLLRGWLGDPHQLKVFSFLSTRKSACIKFLSPKLNNNFHVTTQ